MAQVAAVGQVQSLVHWTFTCHGCGKKRRKEVQLKKVKDVHKITQIINGVRRRTRVFKFYSNFESFFFIIFSFFFFISEFNLIYLSFSKDSLKTQALRELLGMMELLCVMIVLILNISLYMY